MLDLFQPGAYVRCPGGNIERPADQAQAVRWVAWNIGSDPCVNRDPSVWNRARMLWAQAGIADFPWLHCRSLADVERLISVGTQFSSPAIGLNVEDVARDDLSLQQVGGLVRDFWFERFGKPVHMATLPWVQNGQGWQHVNFAVAALEIMPDEQRNIFPDGKYDPVKVDQCISHAFNEGLKKVTLMLKTKNYQPADYGRHFAFCHSLYTADDIAPSQPAWAAWKQPQPCERPTDPSLSLKVAERCRHSWARIIASNVFKRWKQYNPGEWQKASVYWSAAGKPVAPILKTAFGQGLVALTEARRYAEGTHA